MNVYSQGNVQKTRNSVADTLARELAVTETILRSRRTFFQEIRDSVGLQEKIRAMGVSSFVLLALYGAVLGSSHSLWQALSSAAKLPLLFLATALICVPTLYFFNILFGARQSLSQNLALILTPIHGHGHSAVQLRRHHPVFHVDHQPVPVLQVVECALFCRSRHHRDGLFGTGHANCLRGRRRRRQSAQMGAALLDSDIRLRWQPDGLDSAPLHWLP